MNKIKLLNKAEITRFKGNISNNYNEKKYFNISQNKFFNNFLARQGLPFNYVEAAVLCLLEPDIVKNSYNIILTVRSKKLKQHAGQISFPGGKLDKKDKNLIDCAYREAKEEINFNLQHASFLGRLTKYLTGTGYLIQPVISLSINNQDFILNKAEVDDILHFPINHLLLNSKVKKVFYRKNNEKLFYYNIEWKGFKIWGATAKILVDLIYLFKNI